MGTHLARTAPGRRLLLACLAGCAALVAVVLYLNALDNPFVYDDYRLIVENASILHPSDIQTILIRDSTRPVVNLSYAIDTALWGGNPFGYHLTNVLLHAVNVLLVFWVALLASDDRARQPRQSVAASASPAVVAMSTALLFAAHPMLTQAVGYISGRSEVAYGCFFLLAFLAGRRWMLGGGRWWWATCVALWLVAVLTKESAAMLPFVLLAYDWFVLDADSGERRRRFLRLALPLLSLTLLAGVSRIAILQLVEYHGTVTDWRFMLVAVDVFWRYLGMFAVPVDQAIFHAVPMVSSPFAPRALAGMLGLVAFLGAVWGLRRVHSLLAFGLLWFLVIQIPSSVLFTLGIGEPMAEHRAYVAAIGLFLTWGTAFAMLWSRASTRPWGRAIVCAAGVLFVGQMGLKTMVRNAIWGDPVLLSREAIGLAPEHWVPRLLLAEALRHTGRCGEAIPEYRAAISARPQEEFPYTKLAGCLIEERRLDEAETALLQLRTINPESRDASMVLGIVATLKRGQVESATAGRP
ncbi:MAG: hypothetical protein ABL971_10285 [Vicinamibacterales bacterium]